MKDSNWAYFAAGALLGAEAIDSQAVKLTADVMTEVFQLFRSRIEHEAYPPEERLRDDNRYAKVNKGLMEENRDLKARAERAENELERIISNTGTRPVYQIHGLGHYRCRDGKVVKIDDYFADSDHPWRGRVLGESERLSWQSSGAYAGSNTLCTRDIVGPSDSA